MSLWKFVLHYAPQLKCEDEVSKNLMKLHQNEKRTYYQ